MKTPVVIWGAGGHALVVAEVIRRAGICEVHGFIDEVSPHRKGEIFADSTVLGGRDVLEELASSLRPHLIPGIGDVKARLRMLKIASELNLQLATAIHPASVIAEGVAIGDGTAVMAGAIVNPAAELGRAVIVNTASSVDHHCSIADAAHIAPGARLGGAVTVGTGAWIGIGAVIKERVKIGAHAIVGAGAVVIRDVPEGAVVVGNPARVLRTQAAPQG